MLSKSTRRRIKERKIHKHSNPSQLLKRIKIQSSQAIKDLTLVIENLEEEHLEEIVTDEKLEPLLRVILDKKSKRVFKITELFAKLASQKILTELPREFTNNLVGDVQKTLIFAQLLTNYADKPLVKQSKKEHRNS